MDNDVKNFWSTRQKRLTRLLRATLRSRTSNTKIRAATPKRPHPLESASAMMNAACNDMTLCQKMFRSWMRKRMKPGGYLSICLVFWLYYVASYIVLNNIPGCMKMM